MIDYIRGELTYIAPTYLVVEAQGVGYQVQFANSYLFSQRENEEVCLYTYQHVREDVIALYGFASREERGLFEKLIQVSGIGPKGALAILSAGKPGKLIAAIQGEDLVYLTKLPGVGKKTAQRLIIELKDKLAELSGHFGQVAVSNVVLGGGREIAGLGGSAETALDEAVEALISLGYSEKEVHSILPQLKEHQAENWAADQYIKRGLQLLLK